MTVKSSINFFQIFTCLASAFLKNKWAVLHQYLAFHHPLCLYLFWTVSALSYGTAAGGHLAVSSLKNRMLNVVLGVSSFGTQVSQHEDNLWGVSPCGHVPLLTSELIPLWNLISEWQIKYIPRYDFNLLKNLYFSFAQSRFRRGRWFSGYCQSLWMELDGNFVYCLECHWFFLWET